MSLADMNVADLTDQVPPTHPLDRMPVRSIGPDAAAPVTPLEASLPYRAVKRTLDIVLGTAMLLATLPVLVVVALSVRRDGGPAVFRQRRLGKDGTTFLMLKFRSMAVDAEDRLRRDPELYRRYVENDFKLPAEEDPRTTRLGRFLRSSSIDELPQLVNVLRGEMTLVGPRPIVEGEIAEYESRGAAEAYLHAKPGLTGPWQASGRSLMGYDARIALDVDYVENPSVLADVKLLARTARAVVQRAGAH